MGTARDIFGGSFAEIHIRRGETTVDLGGMTPERVTDLRIYSGKKNDLSLLSDYPNVTRLFLQGDFTSIDAAGGLRQLSRLCLYPSGPVDCAALSGLSLRELVICRHMAEHIEALFSPALRLLEIGALRRLSDLSFLEEAGSVEKLYLHGLPAVEALPDFAALPSLYALKLYELHRLSDLESLTRSQIRYLAASLIADKVTGTKLAGTLLAMPKLELADLTFVDRSGSRRYTVLENQLRKAGRLDLLAAGMDYQAWERL